MNSRRAGEGGRGTPSSRRRGEIKAVLFDYGGTLFKSDRAWDEVRAEGLAAVHSLLVKSGLRTSLRKFRQLCDSVFSEYAAAEEREDRDIPDRVKYREIVDRLLPGLPKTERARLAGEATGAFWRVAIENYPMRPGAKKALRELESKGLRMGVVSNHHDYAALMSHLEGSGIHSHFEIVLASEREGVRKPNIAIFAKCLKAMGVQKENALFVGDSPRHDIVGARAAGISTVLIDDGEVIENWRRPAGGLDSPESMPDFVIRDLLELSTIVDSLKPRPGRARSVAPSRAVRRPA